MFVLYLEDDSHVTLDYYIRVGFRGHGDVTL